MAVCDSVPRKRPMPVPVVAVVAPDGPEFAAKAVDDWVGVEGWCGGVVVGLWWMGRARPQIWNDQ